MFYITCMKTAGYFPPFCYFMPGRIMRPTIASHSFSIRISQYKIAPDQNNIICFRGVKQKVRQIKLKGSINSDWFSP